MAGLVVSCRSAQMLTNKYETSPYFQLLFSKTPRQAPCLPCLWPFVAFPTAKFSTQLSSTHGSRLPRSCPWSWGSSACPKFQLSTGPTWYRLVSLGLWPWSWCDDGARVGIVLTNFRGGKMRKNVEISRELDFLPRSPMPRDRRVLARGCSPCTNKMKDINTENFDI